MLIHWVSAVKIYQVQVIFCDSGVSLDEDAWIYFVSSQIKVIAFI